MPRKNVDRAISLVQFTDGPAVDTKQDPLPSHWHIVWVGGQSNACGSNGQTSDYPVWPTTNRVQMFCWDGIPMKRSHGCTPGRFAPAAVPVSNEFNVGFSQTFANLLLPTLPKDHGVLLVNTCEGETGFVTGDWSKDGPLISRSLTAVESMVAALPEQLGGSSHNLVFKALLWHQGEADAGDNREHPVYHAKYCTYLDELSALVDTRYAAPGRTVRVGDGRPAPCHTQPCQ